MYNTSDNKYQFSTISKGVIEKMLIKLNNIKDIKYILEPSACKGNLVKMIKILINMIYYVEKYL